MIEIKLAFPVPIPENEKINLICVEMKKKKVNFILIQSNLSIADTYGSWKSVRYNQVSSIN